MICITRKQGVFEFAIAGEPSTASIFCKQALLKYGLVFDVFISSAVKFADERKKKFVKGVGGCVNYGTSKDVAFKQLNHGDKVFSGKCASGMVVVKA